MPSQDVGSSIEDDSSTGYMMSLSGNDIEYSRKYEIHNGVDLLNDQQKHWSQGGPIESQLRIPCHLLLFPSDY